MSYELSSTEALTASNLQSKRNQLRAEAALLLMRHETLGTPRSWAVFRIMDVEDGPYICTPDYEILVMHNDHRDAHDENKSILGPTVRIMKREIIVDKYNQPACMGYDFLLNKYNFCQYSVEGDSNADWSAGEVHVPYFRVDVNNQLQVVLSAHPKPIEIRADTAEETTVFYPVGHYSRAFDALHALDVGLTLLRGIGEMPPSHTSAGASI